MCSHPIHVLVLVHAHLTEYEYVYEYVYGRQARGPVATLPHALPAQAVARRAIQGL